MGFFSAFLPAAARAVASVIPTQNLNAPQNSPNLNRRAEVWRARQGRDNTFLEFVDGKKGATLLDFLGPQRLVYEQERFTRKIFPFRAVLVSNGSPGVLQFNPDFKTFSLRLNWMAIHIAGAGGITMVDLNYVFFQQQAIRTSIRSRVAVPMDSSSPLVQINSSVQSKDGSEETDRFVSGPIELHRKQNDDVEATANSLNIAVAATPALTSIDVFGEFELTADPADVDNTLNNSWLAAP